MNLRLSFEHTPEFKYFEKSDNVKKIQELLLELGYSVGNAGADGIFGNDTKKALTDFNASGKLKKDGKISDLTLTALKELEPSIDGYKPLSWERTDPSRASWSKFVFQTIDKLFDSSFSLCQDITTFRRNYDQLNRTQKINVWGELISAISKFESGWNPTSRMVEDMGKDPVTGNQVASEGLLQLSYQDGPNYKNKVEIPCKFDWNADKPLFEENPKDPKITILDPYKNLEFGIGILAYQIKRTRKIILKRGEGTMGCHCGEWKIRKDKRDHRLC